MSGLVAAVPNQVPISNLSNIYVPNPWVSPPPRINVHVPFPTHEKFVDDIFRLPLHSNDPIICFHLLCWKEYDSENWQSVLAPNSYNGCYLAFSKHSARTSFSQWWDRYRNLFFKHGSPERYFFPLILPGQIEGVYVEHKTAFDQIPYDFQQITDIMADNASEGLKQCMSAWHWIVANCDQRVFKVPGGWLFSSGGEAAKFVLIDPR